MDSSTVSNEQSVTSRTPDSVARRNRSEQEHIRQAALESREQQDRRAANRQAAERRLAQSAFERSVEQDRALRKSNQQAGVEKMVRSVVCKESAQVERRRSQEDSFSGDSDANADYVRERLNSTYGNTRSESSRDEDLRPSPSQRQQQRAMENYQQSNRNSVDRTVELIV